MSLMTRMLVAILTASAGGVLLTAQEAEPPAIEVITTAFDRHNYKTALQLAERYLVEQPGGAEAVEAKLIKAQCLLKLKRMVEGITQLEALLKGDDKLGRRIDLHELLASAGLEHHTHRHQAIRHFGIAADLYIEDGKIEEAATALIKQAGAFNCFSGWKLLPELDVVAPPDWRGQRKLQEQFALKSLSRATALTPSGNLLAEIQFQVVQIHRRGNEPRGASIGQALDLFVDLADRWPDAPRAAEALFLAGQIYESSKHDYVKAVVLYQRLTQEHVDSNWAKRAVDSAKRITTPTLSLAVEGPVLPGEKGVIHFHSRNVSRIEFKAYAVDLFKLLKKVERLDQLGEWIPDGPAAASWSMAVPDEGKHRYLQSGSNAVDPAVLPVKEAGAYVVIGQSADGKAIAHTVALVSGLACVAKQANQMTLVMSADALSGKPMADADVLIQRILPKNRFEYVAGKTDDAGVYRWVKTGEENLSSNGQTLLLIRRGSHYAVCNSAFYWYRWGLGQGFRAYCFTERPVSRPDQLIHFKAIVRNYQRGAFELLPNHPVDVTVRDAKGEVVDARPMITNDQGSISGDIRLPEGAGLGMYHIQLAINGRPIEAGAGASFRVEEYKKPEYKVAITTDQPDCRIGDVVKIKVNAKYYFGEPVVGASVRCTVYRSRYRPSFSYPSPWPWYFDDMKPFMRRCFLWPGGRWSYPRRDLVGTFESKTSQDGVATISIETAAFDETPEADLRYDIEAEVTDSSRRVITGQGQVKVTHKPFYIYVRPQRNVYQPGDTIRIEVEAKGPNDDPIALRGTCKVYRLFRSVSDEYDAEQDRHFTASYRLGDNVAEVPIIIGEDGIGHLKWVADEEGPFRVVVTSNRADGFDVSGSTDLWIAKRGGRFGHYAYHDLEIVPDKPSYAVGETANILVNTRHEDAYVLLTAEADDLYDHRIVHIPGGTTLVEWPITTKLVPNFNLTATLLRDEMVFQDSIPIVVPPRDRFLNVAVTTDAESFHPRQQLALKVATTDSTDQPAPAEVALMMVDSSIYYVQRELRAQIEKFFYGNKRPSLVQTSTNYDYYSRGAPRFSGKAEAAPMRAMAKSRSPQDVRMEGQGQEASPFATAEVRKDFPDTVLWSAHLMTDEDGLAQVDVTLPDTLTTWRVHAIAVDRDTRVGQSQIDMISQKDVIVRLESPRFLVEGDQAYLTVIAHNYLPQQKTMLISLNSGDRIEVSPPLLDGSAVPDSVSGQAKVIVPAGGQVALDFPARAISVGQTKLTATVAADTDADAIQIELPIIPYGADRFIAQSGSIRDLDQDQTATVSMVIPGRTKPESPRMEIRLQPSMASVMIDALPYLLEYPYGCTEQTMSRFLPAVVVRRTLHQLDVNLDEIRKKIDVQGGRPPARLPARFRNNPVFNDAVMEDIIRKGLERLAELQRPDGGWGWWAGGNSNPYMTAYVVYGLAEAAASKVKFDHAMLSRGVSFLKKRIVSAESAARYAFAADDDNVRTWMLFALSMHAPQSLNEPAVRQVVDRIFEARDELTDYARAMLLISLYRLGQHDRVEILVENLDNTVKIDDTLNTASWGQSRGYRYWYNNGLEATSMVLRALVKVKPDHPYVGQAVKWLVRNRRGARWFSTKDTAMAAYALADYLVASGELDASMTVELTVDDHPARTFAITPENALTFDAQVFVSSKDLKPGSHQVKLTRTGTGNLYYAVYLDYYTREDPIEPASHEVQVTRKYVKLLPETVTRTRSVWRPGLKKHVEESYDVVEYERLPIEAGQAVVSGELIEVQLEITASDNLEYLIFEDPKPAGCEPFELHSGFQAGTGPCVNIELRNQKTALFATYLPQGTHQVTYKLRCQTPGLFHALPATAKAMYSPFVRSNSSSTRLSIVDE